MLILAKLRSLPTAESEKVASVPVGEKVEIIDGGDNGYTHVKYDGTEGYIYSRCISYDQELLGEGGGVIDTLVVDELQNKSEKASSGVYEAKYSSNFLKRHIIAANASAAMTGGVEDAEENLAENDVEVEIPKNNKSTSVINDVASNVIGRKANLRSLPDKDSNRIATINVGADVTVLGASEGGYTMVQYNGVIGYVLEDCVVDHIEVADIVQISGGDPIMFSVTAYCSCKKCCGSYSPEVRGGEAHTATGTVPAEGRTIAVDPSVIPYGTRVYIDGYGTFIAEDCGGAVKGNHIDMYFDTHEGAVAFGSKRLFVTIEQ